MNRGSRAPRAPGAAALGMGAMVGVAWLSGAVAGEIGPRLPDNPQAAGRTSVEIVSFADPRQAPVTVVRSTGAAAARSARHETLSFGNGTAQQVTVVRGRVEAPAGAGSAPIREAAVAPQKTFERVSFGGSEQQSVTVVRGMAAEPATVATRGRGALRDLFPADLFGPAGEAELDRIAEAVHGAESSHGTDPRMWRPDLAGPQGPMQVSAAAAIDLGGGNRFDLAENRLLGRAYLARMFRRYGNWPDALAAYNWGPGNVDQWIARGRDAARLPGETIRYIRRVLRDALVTTAGGVMRPL